MNVKTIATTPATYNKILHSAFSNNPLIEALPQSLSVKDIALRANYIPEIGEEDKHAPDLIRLALVEHIDLAYLASPQLVRLYQTVYAKLMQGYRFRNPLDTSVQRYMYELSANTKVIPRWNQTSASVSLLIGPSGFGKTTTINNLRRLFPEVIQHTSYGDTHLSLLQPVIVYVECPSSGNKSELISSIWNALDSALGTDYAEQYGAASMDPISVQKKLCTACMSHFVGMIIVDELQNLHGNDTTHASKASPRFLEELFNQIGVPVLLVGTWQSVPLLSSSFKTTRRSVGDSPMIERPYGADDGYWKNLVEQLWTLQYCQKFTPLNDEIFQYIYYCTAGLPSLLKRLIKAANQYSIQFRTEIIDHDLLVDVFQNDFCAIHNALNCLRNGDSGGFEDLIKPEQFLPSITEGVSAAVGS